MPPLTRSPTTDLAIEQADQEPGVPAPPYAPSAPKAHSLTWTHSDLVSLALILICAVGLIWRLWAPGVQSRVDMLIGIYRIFELAGAWAEGIWYPRLGPDLNFTYGAPLFQFYPPLVSYLGLLYYGLGLGFIGAAKMTFATSIVMAGVGMYLFARSIFQDRCAAWLSAMMYITAPYLLLDIYERGAAAETLALALLPWLFWALRRLLHLEDRTSFLLSAICVAAFMLAHNITTLFVLPAALGYVLLLAVYGRRWRGLGLVAGATALGLGLCAFYWLPAVLEVKHTHAEEFMLGAGQIVTQGLLPWRNLFQETFVADYQGPLRFRFALRMLLFAIPALLALPFLERRLRYEMGILAVFWFVVMVLQSEGSLLFWQHVPLVHFIQFTWRLYGLASLVVALLIGSLVITLRLPTGYRWGLAAMLVAISLWSSAARLDPALFDIWYVMDEAEITVDDLFARGQEGFPLFGDYQPIAMTPPPFMLTMPQPPDSERFPPIPLPPALQVLRENFNRVELLVDAPAPFTLRAQRIYFPGWQVYVDGRPVPTTPSGKFGLVTAEMPAGTYGASIQFDQTPVRRTGDLLSLLSLAALTGVVAAGNRWRRNWLRGVLAAALVVGLVVTLQRTTYGMRTPVVVPANFEDTLHLLGFQLEKTTWRPGEELHLRLYWYVEQAPLVDYKVFLHVAEPDDSGKVTQLDTTPMFGFSPMTRWESGEFKVDHVRLGLEPGIKPGRYRLIIGVYHPETVENLVIRSGENVLPGDRVALIEVEITDE